MMNSATANDDRPDSKTSKLLLAGIFLVSFSLLALEISLTRVLSVMFAYHYVFLVLSMALLGLGLGAVFVHLFRHKLPAGHHRFYSLALFAGLLSLSMPLSLNLIARISGPGGEGGILRYIPLFFTPFFFGGILMAGVFRFFPAQSSRLYGMDLLGAAAGALAAVFMLNVLGGPGTVAIISLPALLAAALFATKATGLNSRRLVAPVAGSLVILILAGTALVGKDITGVSFAKNPGKEMGYALNEPSLGAEIVETKWSAFGRTDLVALRNQPDQMLLFLDGTAGSQMYQFSGDVKTAGPAIQALKTEFPGYLALSNLPPEEKNTALIIGPGGGRDILVALLAGIDKITAVEVNQDLVDIMRKYSWYNGGIYDLDNVSVVVDEGRSFLRRQKAKYDVIMLSLPVTKTSRSLEGYALTENFLFTTDSINDYLAHLSDDGELVVVTHDPTELLKLLATSLAALNQNGIDNKAAMARIYVIGAHHNPVFVMKKTPFVPGELEPVHQSIHQLGYDPAFSYIPTIKPGSCEPHESGVRFDECGMLDPLLAGLSRGDISLGELTKAFEKEGRDIRPATDDSPFFYKLEAGIPPAVSIIFRSSALILLSLMMVPFIRRRKILADGEALPGDGGRNGKRLGFLVFFAMLGTGFMLVEISIFQRFSLFLGQPVLSLAVLLSSLLAGGGIGSLCSGRLTRKPARVIAVVSLGIIAVLFAYAFATPLIFRQLLGAELATRLFVTVVMITPLGFLMGFPFPLGLRLLNESGMADYIPWMWGINGVGSVLGSAAAIVVAVTSGFTSALLLGAACYLVVFFIFQIARPTRVWERLHFSK
ncbi:MAG: hypothetical protein V1823_03040 [Chloroflexota bacterium]